MQNPHPIPEPRSGARPLRRRPLTLLALFVVLLTGVYLIIQAAVIPEGDTPGTVFRVSSTYSGVWWEYSYHGEALPTNTSKGWFRMSQGGASETLMNDAAGRYLRISSPTSGQTLNYQWKGIPNLPDANNGYTGGSFLPDTWGGTTIEFRARVISAGTGAGSAQYFYFNTTNKTFGLQLTTNAVRWFNGSAISLPAGFSPTHFNTYRLVYTNLPTPTAALYLNNATNVISSNAGSTLSGSGNTINWGDTASHASIGGVVDWDFVRFAKRSHAPSPLSVLVTKRFLSTGGIVVELDPSSSELVGPGDSISCDLTPYPGSTVIATWSDTLTNRFEKLQYIVNMAAQSPGNYRVTARLIDGTTVVGTNQVIFTKPALPAWANQP